MTVHTASPVKCTLAFHLSGWCGQAVVAASMVVARTDQDGYCYLTGVWQDGSTITLNFPMEVSIVSAHPRVREDIGKAAVCRGPVTYCAEEADNGRDLHLFQMEPFILNFN